MGTKCSTAVLGEAGYVATVFLEHRRTVNSEYLPQVFGEIKKINRRRRIILHHNNARSHALLQTTQYLIDQNIKLVMISFCSFIFIA